MSPNDMSKYAVGRVKRRLGGLQTSHKTAIAIALVALVWMLSGVLTNSAPPVAPVSPAAAPTAEAVQPRVRVAVSHSQVHTPRLAVMGRTEAGRAVEVRAEVEGRVVELVADKGDFVAAGAVLVRIDRQDRAERLAEAEARLKQREIAFESAQKLSKGGYSSRLNVAQAQADLEAARAQVTSMKRDLANTTITAPFAGVVDVLPVEVGHYFDKAGQAAARVLDLTTVKAVAQVAERDIGRVVLGEAAQVRLPDGRELTGRVTFVGQSTDAKTRTFPVEVTLDVPDRSVAEGVTAEILLPLSPITGHLISPALLTLDDDGRIGVKAVNAEGIVEFHAVRVSSDTVDGMWLTGLPEEIRVITVGQEFVGVGTKVEAVEGPLPSMHPGTKAAGA